MPRLRRTPLLIAAVVAAATLAAVPVQHAVRSDRVVAQSETAITPIGIAPRLASDSDYLAHAAAAKRVADLAAAKKAAAANKAAVAAAEAQAARNARLAQEGRASRSSNRVAATGPIAYGSPQAIARDQLAQRGWSDQFGCLDNLWSRESGWRTNAANSSGAYGIPQALPGSKMASSGSDWRTNPATQISWGLGYIGSRYSNPCNAWANFQNKGWY